METYYKKLLVPLGFNFELCNGIKSIINLLFRTEHYYRLGLNSIRILFN